MRRGTTPTHTFVLPLDMDTVTSFRVIYAQGDEVKLRKEKDDCSIDGNVITVKLSQEETLSFNMGKIVEIQVRILCGDIAMASDIMYVSVERLLEDEVIE